MGFFDSNDKKSSIADLLEDLTHLEINTIVKEGMLATPAKRGRYDMMRDIFDAYTFKYHTVLKEHESIKAAEENGALYYKLPDGEFQKFVDKKVKSGTWGERFRPQTFKELHVRLKSLNRVINMDESLWLTSRNYTILQRIGSFCEYLYSLRCVAIFSRVLDVDHGDEKKVGTSMPLYETPITVYKFDFEIEKTDQVKVNRMRDLGTETVLMQTRIGLDGDVITRIEKDFTINGGSRKFTEKQATMAKNTVIEMHEKHIDISVKYWNSLVNLVKDFVSGLIDTKK